MIAQLRHELDLSSKSNMRLDLDVIEARQMGLAKHRVYNTPVSGYEAFVRWAATDDTVTQRSRFPVG